MTRPLLAGAVTGLAVTWNVTNVGAIAGVVAREYHTTLATVGLLTAVMFVVQLASTVPGGRVTDRIGARRAGLIALWVAVAANLVLLIAPEPALALPARAPLGVTVGLGFLCGTSYVREAGNSPVNQGVFGAVSLGLGGGLPVAVIPQLEQAIGWRAAYLSALVVAVLAIAVLMSSPSTARRPSGSGVRLRLLIAHPLLARLGLLHVTTFGFSVLVGNWIAPLLTRNGFTAGAAGAVGSLALVGGIISRPGGGLLASWRPRDTPRVLAGGMLLGALATGVLALRPSSIIAVAATGLVGLASGIPYGIALMAAPRAFPGAPAAAAGAMNAYPLLVIVVGNPLMGIAFEHDEGRVAFGVIAALWLAMILAIPSASALGATAGSATDGVRPGRPREPAG